MIWVCENIRHDYKYAYIEIIHAFKGEPYQLNVVGRFSNWDTYKTLQGAKAAFTKNYQSPKWGKDYPKPKWKQTNEYPFLSEQKP